MRGQEIAFAVWALIAIFFVGLGIYDYNAKKPVGFWANAPMFEVKDVKGYNHAVGRLFMIFGIVFMLLGLPLIFGESGVGILFTVIGTMFACIIMMAVYGVFITTKYKK